MPTAGVGIFPISGCDGSVFPTVSGVNPSLTIQAIAIRTADRIGKLAAAGELCAATSFVHELNRMTSVPETIRITISVENRIS